MVSWIHCLHNDIFIGPLSEEEAEKVRSIYQKHGNPFTESTLFLHTPGTIVCSYQNFIAQVEGRVIIGQRGANASE